MCLMKMTKKENTAFTLIELLVVTGVIAVLAALSATVAQSVMSTGRKVAEVNAAKSLITAYITAASERDGKYLPGYDRTVGELTMPDGTAISGPAAERYPYRLAPYLNYQMNGTMLVNNNVKQVDATSSYMVSCFPAFGINYIYVGGDISSAGVMTYPGECVTTTGRGSSSVLVFASAAGSGTQPGGTSDQQISGYCILTPPNTTAQMWSSAKWTKTSPAGNYGNVDARFGGKAVCAYLDGGVRMNSIDELRDMRLWNYNAALQDDANYTVADAVRGGRL